MHDVIYRLDPEGTRGAPAPADAEEAKQRLLRGNRGFMNLFKEDQVIHIAPSSIGIGTEDVPLAQRPFASILSCSDARVPVELIFHCGSNELFVVRVAGNVAGVECLGSLEYAAASMAKSIQLNVVLGHSGCGAVTAAVDTYLDQRNYPRSPPLRAVVDRILPAVRTASTALKREYGGDTGDRPNGREVLIETSVVLNVVLCAMTVRDDLKRPVECGVFDLESREVKLVAPPEDVDGYVALADRLAGSERTRDLLAT